jgi:hypothetical protein
MVSPMQVNNPEQAMKYKILGGRRALLDLPAPPSAMTRSDARKLLV